MYIYSVGLHWSTAVGRVLDLVGAVTARQSKLLCVHVYLTSLFRRGGSPTRQEFTRTHWILKWKLALVARIYMLQVRICKVTDYSS